MISGIAGLRGYQNGGKIPRREFLRKILGGLASLGINPDIINPDIDEWKNVARDLLWKNVARDQNPVMDPSPEQIRKWLVEVLNLDIESQALGPSGGFRARRFRGQDPDTQGVWRSRNDEIWDNSRYRRIIGAPTAKELRAMWPDNINIYSGVRIDDAWGKPSTSLTQRRPEAQVPKRTRGPSSSATFDPSGGYKRPGAFQSPVWYKGGWEFLDNIAEREAAEHWTRYFPKMGRRGIMSLLGAGAASALTSHPLGALTDVLISPGHMGSGDLPEEGMTEEEKLELIKYYRDMNERMRGVPGMGISTDFFSGPSSEVAMRSYPSNLQRRN